jgi:hypothetical protein
MMQDAVTAPFPALMVSSWAVFAGSAYGDNMHAVAHLISILVCF